MNRFGNFFKPAMWTMALLAATVVAGCGGGGGGSAPAAPAAAATGPAICSGNVNCVNLATSANYAILAQSGVTTVPTSAVTGDVGLNAAATGLTGFSETLPAGGASSTSAQVTGNIFASDYAVPTPDSLTTASTDAGTAYTQASTMTPTLAPNPTAGVIPAVGSPPVAPGVYNWTGNVAVTDTTLDGGANDVWVFQVAGNLTQAANTTVTLVNGAQAKNVFWAVAGVTTLHAGAHLEGVVLDHTAIVLQTGATANGRLIAGTAVTLDNSTVIQP
jgi:Ice-binding-like